MTAGPAPRDGKRFRNPQPIWNDYLGAAGTLLRTSRAVNPGAPIPLRAPVGLEGPGLHATWLGHSTVHLGVDGTRILTDPVWGERPSPLPFLGPRRFFPPPLALEALPVPHAVAISHDHYDHLDLPTIRRMRSWDTRFIVPLGVGARLEREGIARGRITELDWWERIRVGEVEIVLTPARHASGRTLLDRDRTLWGGFAFLGPSHRVYYSGDTGLFRGLEEIGRLGPFDLTLLECGAYDRAWPDWHLGPEQAVQAHRLVRGAHLLPVHWGTFRLAPHGWTEPVERLLAAADGIPVLTPRPGETVVPGSTATERWWPDLPWLRAREFPIRATLDGRRPLAPTGP